MNFVLSCRQQPGAILFPGRWSEEGCETNFNSTMTVCKCNHLTHFAILLSARPLDLSTTIEGEGTDADNNIIISVMTPLESAVLDSIMEDGLFNSVLIQVC